MSSIDPRGTCCVKFAAELARSAASQASISFAARASAVSKAAVLANLAACWNLDDGGDDAIGDDFGDDGDGACQNIGSIPASPNGLTGTTRREKTQAWNG